MLTRPPLIRETRRPFESAPPPQLDERREVQVQQLLKAPQQDQLVPNQPRERGGIRTQWDPNPVGSEPGGIRTQWDPNPVGSEPSGIRTRWDPNVIQGPPHRRLVEWGDADAAPASPCAERHLIPCGDPNPVRDSPIHVDGARQQLQASG